MKISPIPSGGMPGIDLRSGEPIPSNAEGQNLKRITMRTNVSPDRPIAEPAQAQVEAPTQESVISDNTEPTTVTEATKPLSPQLAAIAKQRRAVQQERALIAKEKAEIQHLKDLEARLKAQPMSVLRDLGVTYDQLTESILADSSGSAPQLQEINSKLKALEENLEQKFITREQQAEQQALTEMLWQAEDLAKEGDEFSLIRSEDESAYREVLTRIYNTYKKTGRVPDVREIMQTVENELLDKYLKYASIEKIKSKLIPPAPPVQEKRPNQIRTLTNRDSSPVGLSRRERAIMAMNGTLTKG